MTRALLIILADHVASARALATATPFSLTEEEAGQLFVPTASPTGSLPATHWCLSGDFNEAHWNAIQGLAMLLPWADCHAYDLVTQPDFVRGRLTALNLLPVEVPQS